MNDFEKRAQEFQKDLMELIKKHGVGLVPVIGRYGLEWEFVDERQDKKTVDEILKK